MDDLTITVRLGPEHLLFALALSRWTVALWRLSRGRPGESNMAVKRSKIERKIERPKWHVDARELARLLGVQRETVGWWARSGRIPRFVLGPKTIRYDVWAVLDALGLDAEQLDIVPPAELSATHEEAA